VKLVELIEMRVSIIEIPSIVCCAAFLLIGDRP
jgi:hypothetical protein